MSTTTFVFLRHAESEGLHHSLVGRNNRIGLSTKGFEQCRKLASLLVSEHFTAVYVSPQLRTLQTAATALGRLTVTLQTNDALDECDFGAWTGMDFDALELLPAWKQFNRFRSVRAAPGGESLREVQNRIINFLTHLHVQTKYDTAVEHPHDPILIVTHADVIRSAIAHFAGIPLDLMLRLQIDAASLSVIDLHDWGATIRYLNRSADARLF